MEHLAFELLEAFTRILRGSRIVGSSKEKDRFTVLNARGSLALFVGIIGEVHKLLRLIGVHNFAYSKISVPRTTIPLSMVDTNSKNLAALHILPLISSPDSLLS